MNETILCFVLGAAAAGMIGFVKVMKLRNELQNTQDRGILDDLEFATKDQLLKEFRSRPNNIYVLLTPVDNKSEQGMKIELNNCNSYDAVTMLHLSTILIHKEMKQRGMQVPKLEKFWDEDDMGEDPDSKDDLRIDNEGDDI